MGKYYDVSLGTRLHRCNTVSLRGRGTRFYKGRVVNGVDQKVKCSHGDGWKGALSETAGSPGEDQPSS